jgi:four helix bundle protein
VEFAAWLAKVPESLKKDPIWGFAAYPKALFLSDLAWEDSAKLLEDVRGREIARQLIRSAGSVSANIGEGYGRGMERAEYVQFLRYALGSARETRSWYYKARYLLSDSVCQPRMGLCSEIIALLVTTIKRCKNQRS